MKRVWYIISAALAAAGIAFYLPELLNLARTISIWERPDYWYSVIGRFPQCGVVIVFFLFALLQLKKSTPRLLLLLSGTMFFDAFSLIVYGQLFSIFFMAAGIIPVILEISRVPKPAGRPPIVRARYDGLLTAAGVFAIMSAGYNIISAIMGLFTYIGFDIDIPAQFYVSIYVPVLLEIVQNGCLGIFCFRKELRASVLYRMFFIGSAVVSVLLIPASIAYYSMVPSSLAINWIVMPVSMALVLLVLIHTAKTRRFDPLPQEFETQQPRDPTFTTSDL